MSDSLSICFVSTFYPPYHHGGEAMYLYMLANELAEAGHRVTVVHCVDAYELLTKEAPRGEFPHHENVTVHPIRTGHRVLSPLLTYLSGRPGLKSKALDAIFDDADFDVVHFHLSTLFGPGVLRYGAGAVRLYTAHDHWLVCPMYDLWKNNEELCEKPACVRCQMAFRRPPQLWRGTRLLDTMLPNVDLFLAPSHSTIEQHRRRGFPYPMERLQYFLPASRAETPPADARAALAAERPYFLFVGRLVKIKGVQTLIEAFREDPGADLVIAGDGPYRAELERQSARLSHVRLVGRVHPDPLRLLYANAIATLVPSLVYETFGLIALESFAQRTPVIGRNIGAVGELIRESGAGFTYDTQDELVRAMHTLRTDLALRDDLGNAGHSVFLERFTEKPHLRRYLELIELARSRSEARRAPELVAT